MTSSSFGMAAKISPLSAFDTPHVAISHAPRVGPVCAPYEPASAADLTIYLLVGRHPSSPTEGRDVTTELYWMTLTVLMTALFWVPYALDRGVVRGIGPWLLDTGPEGSGPQSRWARRAARAHLNAVETLAIFVPGVLPLQVLGISTPATRAAVVVYFFARLAHFLVYTAGIPAARTIAFAVGWGA